MTESRNCCPRSTWLFRASWTLYVLSLCFSCYYLEGEPLDLSFPSDISLGIVLLGIGWMGILSGEIAWIANPLWGIGVLLSCSARKRGELVEKPLGYAWMTLIFSLVAQVLALTFLFQATTFAGSGAAGVRHEIVGYGPGYFLWNFSITMQFLGAATLLREIGRAKAKSFSS